MPLVRQTLPIIPHAPLLLTRPPRTRCYVGKQKLEAGIAAYRAAHPAAADTFAVSWHPYYLNPAAPAAGVAKQEYYVDKFGAERTALMQQRLGAVGRAVGIDFRFGGRTGRTRDSHRLIRMAATRGGPDAQGRVVAALFRGYFERERDITSRAFLEEAGADAGLDRAEVKGWLESDAGGADVDAEVEAAQAQLISGVPNFTIQGQFEVRGAQEPEGFKTIFEKIKAMEG